MIVTPFCVPVCVAFSEVSYSIVHEVTSELRKLKVREKDMIVGGS